MTKKLFFIFILFLIPNFCFAIDLTKGLQEAPENWKERTKFIEGKGSLRTASIEQYPIPFFMLAAGGSTIFTFDTEKETYQAGEKVNFHIEAKNSGFIKKAFLNFKERKIHYWWSAGNFFVEIYHLSDEVKDGEFLVASGKVFKDDAISVFQEQSREFNFDWLIPESTKGGNYEIRVYPLSKDIFFDGSPESYRVLMKTRIRINGKDKEELVAWDLAEMKLDDAPVRLKEKVVYLEAGNKYNLSIPLINQGNEREQILVSKRILRLSPEYGQAKNEEIQRVTLEPEEKKLINFEISENNIGKEGVVMAFLSFKQAGNNQPDHFKNYFDYPIGSEEQESIIVPLYVKGNVNYYITGLGIKVISPYNDLVISPGMNYFVEVRRSDPLFRKSASRERAKENNINIKLSLLDEQGNKLDEVAYDGPSWDRSGEIYKIFTPFKKFEYFKLIASLGTKDEGEIDKKEIEYRIPNELMRESLYEKTITVIRNRLMVFLRIILSIVIALGGLVIWFIRKRSKNNNDKDIV